MAQITRSNFIERASRICLVTAAGFVWPFILSAVAFSDYRTRRWHENLCFTEN